MRQQGKKERFDPPAPPIYRPNKKQLKVPTKAELDLIQRYGKIILAEIAYGLKDKCRRPFGPDGSLTQEGLEAAREIVDNLFYACGDERFFDEVTEGVLSTFSQFYDHEPEYGIE